MEGVPQNGGEVERKQSRCRYITLFDPVVNGEFFCQLTIEVDAAFHGAMKLPEFLNEIRYATKLQEYLPQSIAIDCIESLSEIAEYLTEG